MNRRKLLFIFLGVLVIVLGVSFASTKKNDPSKDKFILEIVSYILEKGHFDPKKIDDSFSELVFTNYLQNLDEQKRFFLAGDIEQLSIYKELIDEELKNHKIDFFNISYKKYKVRFNEIKSFYKEILSIPFDFEKDDSINLSYANLSYAKTIEELELRWRKNLKLSVLNIYTNNIRKEQFEKERDSSYVMRSKEILEKEARETTLDNMNTFFEYMADVERKDWFALYINTISSLFDPHTFYFAPQEKEDFDVSISGQYEGIGARLQKKDEEIKIVELLSGGPVARDNLLSVGDVILKVAQIDGDPVAVTGMRLEDVIKYIKGPKGTKVILTIKRVAGAIEEVTIIRDVIEIEETYAKSTVILDEKKIGLINLPKFYINFENLNKRNATSDIRKEIINLKKEGIEGLIIDLRNNVGGSLKTAVDITGFFIEKGPVVQVKSLGNTKEILSDDDPSLLWKGPLVILVNEISASASEILAAALQDYKRAFIIGSHQTYGKGTVQKLISLNNTIKQNSYGDLGAIKITTDKFYRINGSSTQLEGVKSDIILPTAYSYINIGERDLEYPLTCDTISVAAHTTWTTAFDYDYVQYESKKRIEKDSLFQLIDEQAKWIKKEQEKDIFSLNYEKHISELDVKKEYSKKFDILDKYSSDLEFELTAVDSIRLEGNEKSKDKRVRWHKNLKKDIYLYEAVKVINDIASLEK